MVPEIWSKTNIIFCHSGPFFALLPPMEPQNQNFQKNGKNTLKILSFTNTNDSHFVQWKIFLSFWTAFCTFTHPPPPNNPKNQNFEKMKKTPGDILILHFYTCVP